MMDVSGLITGRSTFLVGVEDDPEGGVRCYLGHRSNGHYCVIEDETMIKQVRAAWARGGHVVMPTPPAEFIYSDRDDLTDPSDTVTR